MREPVPGVPLVTSDVPSWRAVAAVETAPEQVALPKVPVEIDA